MRSIAWKPLLRRRGLMIVAIAAAVAAVAILAARDQAASYQASALVYVPSGADKDGPGSANDAVRLATNYAELIPKDDRLVRAIATASGMSPGEVSGALRTWTVRETSLLQIEYRADNAKQARAGVVATVDAITSSNPATPAIAPGSVVPVSMEHDVRATTGPLGPAQAGWIGLILGLALGLVLAITWDRGVPRVDTLEQLREIVPKPATDLDRLARSSVAAMLQRWLTLTEGQSTRVAVLMASRGQVPIALRVVKTIEDVAAGFHVHVQTDDAAGDVARRDTLDIKGGGAPGTHEAGESLALGAALTVLAVSRGTRVHDVTASWRALTELGREPQWALLVERRLPKRRNEGSTSTNEPPTRARRDRSRRAAWASISPSDG